MKITFTSILVFALCAANAQVTITQSDMPSSGDTLRFSVASNPISIDPGNAGSNQTWDFRNLQSSSQFVDNFLSVSQTQFTYVATFGLPFSGSYSDMGRLDNSAFQIPTIPLVNITIEDVFNFYKSNSSSFDQKGFGVSLNGFPVPIPYSGSDVLVPLPLSSGTTSSNAYSFNANIPTIGYYGRNAVRNNLADASGTLRLPMGDYQAVRLRSELVYTDSISIDALGFGFQLPELTEIKYKWMAPGFGWPLLEITANSVFGVETISRVVYRDTLPSNTNTGIPSHFEEGSMLLFPNPASDVLVMKLTMIHQAELSIRILDLAGREVFIQNRPAAQGNIMEIIQLGPANLASGTYLLEVKANQEQAVVRPFLVNNQ